MERKKAVPVCLSCGKWSHRKDIGKAFDGQPPKIKKMDVCPECKRENTIIRKEEDGKTKEVCGKCASIVTGRVTQKSWSEKSLFDH